MSDDLLKALGKVGREEQAAAARDIECAPVLDVVARERLAKAALDELSVREKARSLVTDAEEAGPEGSVTRRSWLALAGVIATAASILFLLRSQPHPLPVYQLFVGGGTSEWRGDAGASADGITVREDGPLEILVRPAVPIDVPVQARAIASHDATERTLPVEVSPQGVVRVAGTAGELFGRESGTGTRRWRVVIWVFQTGRVETSLEAQAAGEARKIETTVSVTSR